MTFSVPTALQTALLSFNSMSMALLCVKETALRSFCLVVFFSSLKVRAHSKYCSVGRANTKHAEKKLQLFKSLCLAMQCLHRKISTGQVRNVSYWGSSTSMTKLTAGFHTLLTITWQEIRSGMYCMLDSVHLCAYFLQCCKTQSAN